MKTLLQFVIAWALLNSLILLTGGNCIITTAKCQTVAGNICPDCIDFSNAGATNCFSVICNGGSIVTMTCEYDSVTGGNCNEKLNATKFTTTCTGCTVTLCGPVNNLNCSGCACGTAGGTATYNTAYPCF
jgi:hypothetical protein